MSERLLDVEPLSRVAFAPFGEVIDCADLEGVSINDGTATRFRDLANLDVCADGGRPCLSLFRAQSRKLPMTIETMERHPLASQAFLPLHRRPFLVVVAPVRRTLDPGELRAFRTNGVQGVNYRRGVWHHALVALEEGEFLVLDRIGDDLEEGDNLEETAIVGTRVVVGRAA